MESKRLFSALITGSILLAFVTWGCSNGSSNNPGPTSAAPDSLAAEWNATAMSLTPSLGTHMGIRALAMMHTAIYDAVVAFEDNYSPYHVSDLPLEGASQRAAAAAAAYHILTTVFTADDQRATIQARYDGHLSQIEDGPGKDAGIAFGQGVAQQIMVLRSTDGAMAAMQAQHPDGTQPGEWRRTASGEPMAPGWGGVTPWAMSLGHEFDQGGPPPLNSQEYAVAYEEVRALGGKNSPIRTAEQSHLAMFWNPHVPAKWTSLARTIAAREGLSLVESSRLFGLLSVTLADAAISVWNMKYAHNFWRPETAIRLGDTDGNDQTVEDPAWEPYLTTPAFPECVSGHSLTCAAAATLLGRYLGTDAYAFELTTMGIPEPRSYTSLWQAVQEAGMSRIYGGIHFDFSDEQGQLAGTDLAHHVFDNFFRPL